MSWSEDNVDTSMDSGGMDGVGSPESKTEFSIYRKRPSTAVRL